MWYNLCYIKTKKCTFDTREGQSMNDCDFSTTCETKLGGCFTADAFVDQENNYVHTSGCLDTTDECKLI